MSRLQISYFSEETTFVLKEKAHVREWIKNTISNEGFRCGALNFIFCTDEYLLTINKQYLDHDTYTDIVTFDSSEVEDLIEGDIFISIDRVRENALKYSKTERDELHRVIIHGVLHLLGYKDKSDEDEKKMRSKEDEYLSKRKF